MGLCRVKRHSCMRYLEFRVCVFWFVWGYGVRGFGRFDGSQGLGFVGALRVFRVSGVCTTYMRLTVLGTKDTH